MEKHNKIRNFSEADLILLYQLERLAGNENSALLQEWLDYETTLNPVEQALFDMTLADAKQNM